MRAVSAKGSAGSLGVLLDCSVNGQTRRGNREGRPGARGRNADLARCEDVHGADGGGPDAGGAVSRRMDGGSDDKLCVANRSWACGGGGGAPASDADLIGAAEAMSPALLPVGIVFRAVR